MRTPVSPDQFLWLGILAKVHKCVALWRPKHYDAALDVATAYPGSEIPGAWKVCTVTRLGMAQAVALLLAILAGMVLSAEAPRPCCYLGDKEGYRGFAAGMTKGSKATLCCVYTPMVGYSAYAQGHRLPARPTVCAMTSAEGKEKPRHGHAL